MQDCVRPFLTDRQLPNPQQPGNGLTGRHETVERQGRERRGRAQAR
jgi:hypothetical protein